jgi:hypothetical protein
MDSNPTIAYRDNTSKFIRIFGLLQLSGLNQMLRVDRVEKCNNRGVKISEEDYYLNVGPCEKCYYEILDEDNKLRNVDV